MKYDSPNPHQPNPHPLPHSEEQAEEIRKEENAKYYDHEAIQKIQDELLLPYRCDVSMLRCFDSDFGNTL